MIRRSTVWLLAAISIPINLAGGVWAAAEGEVMHAGTHAGLLVLGVYLVLRLARSRGGRSISHAGSVNPPQLGEFTNQLTHLEQSLDAIAIEVERIGEGQRFITRLFENDNSHER